MIFVSSASIVNKSFVFKDVGDTVFGTHTVNCLHGSIVGKRSDSPRDIAEKAASGKSRNGLAHLFNGLAVRSIFFF